MFKNCPAGQGSVFGHAQLHVKLLKTYGEVQTVLLEGQEQPPNEFETNGEVHITGVIQVHVVELRI